METNESVGKILVVDDEADICEVLKFNLENENFSVETVSSGESAWLRLPGDFQLILLDIMMGGMSGFQLAQKIRKQGILIPIIFLTAKDTENDMLTGFSVGGDDYISKPFSVKEVIARVKAVLKRGRSTESTEEKIVIDDMEINCKNKQLYLSEQAVMLTKKEFEILILLVRNPGQVFNREDILNRVWQNEGYVLDRTVDVHIARLRKKLGAYGARIMNRTGYGYFFN